MTQLLLTQCSKNKLHSHWGTEFDLIIYINYVWSFISARMTDCAKELSPELFACFFVCVWMWANDIRTRRAVQRALNYSYPAGINHAIYPGVKLSCSKPHEFILAWDKSVITRDNLISQGDWAVLKPYPAASLLGNTTNVKAPLAIFVASITKFRYASF